MCATRVAVCVCVSVQHVCSGPPTPPTRRCRGHHTLAQPPCPQNTHTHTHTHTHASHLLAVHWLRAQALHKVLVDQPGVACRGVKAKARGGGGGGGRGGRALLAGVVRVRVCVCVRVCVRVCVGGELPERTNAQAQKVAVRCAATPASPLAPTPLVQEEHTHSHTQPRQHHTAHPLASMR
jgi:hypothetical protein